MYLLTLLQIFHRFSSWGTTGSAFFSKKLSFHKVQYESGAPHGSFNRDPSGVLPIFGRSSIDVPSFDLNMFFYERPRFSIGIHCASKVAEVADSTWFYSYPVKPSKTRWNLVKPNDSRWNPAKPSKTQWNPVGPQKIESTAKKKKSSSRVLARRVWWWNVPPCHRSAPHSCHWRLTGRPTGPPEEKKERMNEWKNVNYLSTAAGRPSSSSSSGSTFFFLSLPFSFFPFWRWKKREKLIKKNRLSSGLKKSR